MTSPGSPRVVARWGRKPVPKIDAILKYGQPSAQVLSYGPRLTRSTTSPLAGDAGRRRAGSSPARPPKQTRIAAIVATRRRAGEPHRERPDDERQDAREQGAGREVDRDEVDAGHGRGDRAVEVGEPVVGQRARPRSRGPRAGSCRPRCSSRSRRGRAGRSSSSRRLTQPSGVSCQPLCPGRRGPTRPVAVATIQAGASARRAADEAGPGRPRERRQPAMADLRDDDRARTPGGPR